MKLCEQSCFTSVSQNNGKHPKGQRKLTKHTHKYRQWRLFGHLNTKVKSRWALNILIIYSTRQQSNC